MISPEIIKKALVSIKRGADYEYFFSQLQSSDWVLPLRDAGLFKSPPVPIRAGSSISYSRWPESEYLLRVAQKSPVTVIETILQVPDTENVRVLDDFIRAAIQMPPNIAVRIVPKAVTWVQYPYLLLPERMGELISHLARGGHSTEALSFTRELLAVFPDERIPEEIEFGGEKMVVLSYDPHPRFRAFSYKVILNKNIPDLVNSAGVETLTLLCDLLESAISFKHKYEKCQPEDYSYIWRPDIESTSFDDNEVIGALITSVYRAAKQMILADPTRISVIIKLIEERPWHIFHRIGLYLLHQFPQGQSELIAERLLTVIQGDIQGLWNEFFQLAKVQFGILSDEQQKQVLTSIEAGFNLQLLNERREKDTAPPLGDETERRAKMWLRDYLTPFYDHLSEEQKYNYNLLITEVGKREHPEYLGGQITHHVGYKSPQSADEMRLMSVEEIVAFLQTWKPAEHALPFEENPEGLGKELSTIITDAPQRFAAEAGKLIGLEPTYVRSFLFGLWQAVRAKKEFDWCPVLNLCQWVLEQPFESIPRKNWSHDRDPDWGWTRNQIADLLSAGFDLNLPGIHFELRKSAWEVLFPLTLDPSPSDNKDHNKDSSMDPVTRAINTPRGEAMHAVVYYALWVRHHLEKDGSGNKVNFDNLPEVREVLNYHLLPENDASLAIRSVYGRLFPWIATLDPEWTKQNLAIIFPDNEKYHDLRDAAWGAYIVYCPPYDNAFDILKEEYARAIERIGEKSVYDDSSNKPDYRLAEHLMQFYWRGSLELYKSENLLQQFFKKASDQLRGHATWYAGYTLNESEEIVPPEVIDRLKKHWKWRITEAQGAASAKDFSTELSQFGLWFSSRKLGDEWALQQLKKGLEISSKVMMFEGFTEFLAELTRPHSLLAIQCLELIVDGGEENLNWIVWQKETRTILSDSIQSDIEEVKKIAENIIHRLGARGYFEFRSLLSEHRP